VQFRADHLRLYQDDAYAARFLALVKAAPEPLQVAVAKGYHKLLAYKDEYEVARLHLATLDKASAEFDGTLRPEFHLAPPFLPGKDALGRPKKRAFGAWMLPAFRMLSRLKSLRGTVFDPFGRSAERRAERDQITLYEADMARIFVGYTAQKHDLALELAELPLTIRGFGPVKAANAAKAAQRRADLLAAWQGPAPAPADRSTHSIAAE